MFCKQLCNSAILYIAAMSLNKHSLLLWRENETHAKIWARDLGKAGWWFRSFLPFYFRGRAFSISLSRLSRSLEEAGGPTSSQAKPQPHAKRRRHCY